MGLPTGLDNRHPEFLKAIDHLLALGKKHGVPAGIHTGGPEAVNEMLPRGFQFVAMNSDAGFMMQAAGEAWARVKVNKHGQGEKAVRSDTY